MADTKHDCFEQPEDRSVKLWRYMEFTKFTSLLADSQIFFSRSDRFEDPFEGSFSKKNLISREALYKEQPEQVRKFMTSKMGTFVKNMRKWIYISCWHENEHESAAMWKLYSQTNESIAIETSYSSLDECLSDDVYLGKVKYVDYEKDIIPEGNLFHPFMHKRKSFEHEREVRAVVIDWPIDGEKMDFEKENAATGKSIKIDLRKLVKCIHISPTSPTWFAELVARTIKQFNYDFQTRKSDLYSSPVF